ncbi:MAG: alanine--tRNA ligase [Planctomycetaceae bacterium]|nr:alanine--tRNA ligase [Planctomycetaceae bacterium]
MKTDELREKYLAFFETKGCVRRPSDVLVPRWDPSVLFTPAGMNQFKDHFLGRCKLDFTRATTCQKCLRTGDIDNVGRTAYHHTFFEMLGNFSFGDYFKRDAIHWAWEFLTGKKWLGLDPDALSATVYLDDDEAADIWLNEIKLSSNQVTRLGEDENFWPANAPSQGPDGVCGPCSEIYFRTPSGQVEIWNLVFTQFNRVGDPPDNLKPLPSKNIDTGMGLERTAAVLQGVETNFHIDILRPLVEAAGEVCGVRYDPADENGRRLRRIADHVRACTFAVHENVYPGNKKQGYVVRRLLRRAVLDGHQMGVREPFLHKLVGRVAELMKRPYPELGQTVTAVASVIENEEANFLGNLDAGLDRIERIFQDMQREHRSTVSAADAADMFQTHGFPPELFETLAAERNVAFDWKGFHAEMEQHGIDSGGGQKVELFRQDPLDGLKKAMHGSRFLGYETLEVSDAKVVAIIANGQLCDYVDEVDHDEPIVVVLDKTPFYGEMGGQVGDTGEIVGRVGNPPSQATLHFEVIDSQIDGGFTLHRGHLREGRIELDATVTARVDAERRQGIRRAHSATHVLHYALQKHLGKHALQQGSKVDDDWLRFDFTNPSALSEEELVQIENEVNAKILAGEPITCTTLPLAEARKSGAMMLFGEKYPDVVRMVSAGDFSKELCGGTHLTNTALVGIMKIIGEESVAAGTRRITALTGRRAMESIRQIQTLLRRTGAALRASAEELPERVEAMTKEIRQLRKQAAAGPKSGSVSVEQLIAGAAEVAGVKVVIAEVPGGPNDLRQLIDQLRRKAAPIAVLLANRQEEEKKVTLIAGLSRDLVDRGLDAVKWVRSVSALVEGGGGGRPDMAQAGGKLPDKLPDALAAARSQIEKRLAG